MSKLTQMVSVSSDRRFPVCRTGGFTAQEYSTVIGDKAYSSKKNIDAVKDGHYELVARLNDIITQGNRAKPDEFEFNKDARMYQYKAGHLAVRKYFDKRKNSGKNPRAVYFLMWESVKKCPYKEGCYKEGKRLLLFYTVLAQIKQSMYLEENAPYCGLIPV